MRVLLVMAAIVISGASVPSMATETKLGALCQVLLAKRDGGRHALSYEEEDYIRKWCNGADPYIRWINWPSE